MLKDLKVRKVRSDIPSALISLEASLDDHVFMGKIIDEKYKIKNCLGYGTYGKVFTVLDQEDRLGPRR